MSESNKPLKGEAKETQQLHLVCPKCGDTIPQIVTREKPDKDVFPPPAQFMPSNKTWCGKCRASYNSAQMAQRWL